MSDVKIKIMKDDKLIYDYYFCIEIRACIPRIGETISLFINDILVNVKVIDIQHFIPWRGASVIYLICE